MGKRVFVGNLSFRTTEESLRQAFEAEGLPIAVTHIVLDRDTGQPRGFGFAEFETDEGASEAVGRCDGLNVDGRAIRLSLARDRDGPGSFGGPGPRMPMAQRPPRPDGPRPAPVRPDRDSRPLRHESAAHPPRHEASGDDAMDRPPFRESSAPPRDGQGFRADGPPPRRNFDRPPPRLPRFGDAPPFDPNAKGDDRPRRRERPKPPGTDDYKKPKRKMTPEAEGRRKAPKYRDVDDWEEDEDLY